MHFSAGIYNSIIETLPFAFVKEETMIVPITCVMGYTVHISFYLLFVGMPFLLDYVKMSTYIRFLND